MFFIEDCGNQVNIHTGIFVESSECTRLAVTTSFNDAMQKASLWAAEKNLNSICDYASARTILISEITGQE